MSDNRTDLEKYGRHNPAVCESCGKLLAENERLRYVVRQLRTDLWKYRRKAYRQSAMAPDMKKFDDEWEAETRKICGE